MSISNSFALFEEIQKTSEFLMGISICVIDPECDLLTLIYSY